MVLSKMSNRWPAPARSNEHVILHGMPPFETEEIVFRFVRSGILFLLATAMLFGVANYLLVIFATPNGIQRLSIEGVILMFCFGGLGLYCAYQGIIDILAAGRVPRGGGE